jgi:hypothetical protein
VIKVSVSVLPRCFLKERAKLNCSGSLERLLKDPELLKKKANGNKTSCTTQKQKPKFKNEKVRKLRYRKIVTIKIKIGNHTDPAMLYQRISPYKFIYTTQNLTRHL